MEMAGRKRRAMERVKAILQGKKASKGGRPKEKMVKRKIKYIETDQPSSIISAVDLKEPHLII